MNAELRALVRADQADRVPHPVAGTPEYLALRERDASRRRRLGELLDAGRVVAPADLYDAAWLLNHGDEVGELGLAHELAARAAAAGHGPARWLAAATLDRWLMYQGRPQRFGTQFVPDGQRHRLWDVDPATTDADRAAHDVPSLAEQEERAAQLTREQPMPPMADAPWWLQEAMARWSAP
ncbi:hypothetical protein [Nocardioides plantarum]|uniref:Uncharacterized protein n=1 Tax=Nocardioides plantarum TaxID=29299 RepID=A0ABV5KEZ9_9ACTN|nr:hypothetical protein [Nocardioides plantarum]